MSLVGKGFLITEDGIFCPDCGKWTWKQRRSFLSLSEKLSYPYICLPFDFESRFHINLWSKQYSWHEEHTALPPLYSSMVFLFIEHFCHVISLFHRYSFILALECVVLFIPGSGSNFAFKTIPICYSRKFGIGHFFWMMIASLRKQCTRENATDCFDFKICTQYHICSIFVTGIVHQPSLGNLDFLMWNHLRWWSHLSSPWGATSKPFNFLQETWAIQRQFHYNCTISCSAIFLFAMEAFFCRHDLTARISLSKLRLYCYPRIRTRLFDR